MKSKTVSYGIVILGLCLGFFSELNGEAVRMAVEIAPGVQGSGPSYLTPYRGELYFRAYTQTSGIELWKYDGQQAVMVADIVPGAGSSMPSYLTVFKDKLYFAASVTGGTRLYCYDGRNSGPVAGAENCSVPEDLIVFGDSLYFRATYFALYGMELWRYDGQQVRVIDLWPGKGSSGPKELVVFQNDLYFNAVNQELWKLNDTLDGAVQVTDIAQGQGSSPENIVAWNDALCFSAYDYAHGRELWRYRPGLAPQMIADISPGGQYSSSNPNGLAVYRNMVYFSARDTLEHGYELWRYDGAQAQMIADINPNLPENGDDFLADSSPGDFVVFDDLLYFVANDGEHGRMIWRFDGSSLDMLPNSSLDPHGAEPAELTVFGDSLYLRASDMDHGQELWEIKPCQVALSGDTNRDCYVNVADFEAIITNWLDCSNPFDKECQ